MVRLGVDGVGADGVDAELLENRDISFTDRLISGRVDVLVAARRSVTCRSSTSLLLVSDTLQVELVAALGEELGSLISPKSCQ